MDQGCGATMRPSGYPENGILSIFFNQDKSRIAVGTKTGTKTYSTENLSLIHEQVGDDASIVAMHYNTDLVAHVGAGEGVNSSQRCLRMINMRRHKEITSKNFGKTILDVKLNRERLVVVLETTIHIYDLKSMEHLHTIEEIPQNEQGICALPSLEGVTVGNTDSPYFNYLAYPNNTTRGFVHVYDVINLRAGPVIDAHNSRVSCISFNDTGTMLATASSKGTVFRVFSMPDGEKIHEFRRGLATNATIYSMAFDVRSTLLCVSSDKQTIHLFKLETPTPVKEEDKGWGNYLTSKMSDAATYLPTSVSEMFTQSRSFAQVTLTRYGTPNLVALSGTADNVFVLVATSDGYLYKYAVDVEKGGECSCEVTYTLTKTTPKLGHQDDTNDNSNNINNQSDQPNSNRTNDNGGKNINDGHSRNHTSNSQATSDSTTSGSTMQ